VKPDLLELLMAPAEEAPYTWAVKRSVQQSEERLQETTLVTLPMGFEATLEMNLPEREGLERLR